MKDLSLHILELKPLRIAVFLSGNGRTLQNFIDVSPANKLVISAVGSNNPTAYGIRRAFHAHIENFASARNADTSEVLLRFAEHHKAQLICLAGYTELLNISAKWAGKVINIHPALLPKFGGKSMYGSKVHKAVLEAGETESGCTVHFCDNEYDHGPTILQKKLNINPQWDHQQLADAVFELEKTAYLEAINLIRHNI